MTVTQRSRGRVPLDQRSALASMSGVPWWGALACAAIPITIGYLVDAMAGTELTMFFSTMFFIGCLAAVLIVQNKSLFTAMVQPPLLMIVAVPLAYKTFAVGPTQGLKSLVLDIILPLIDRFPTMAITTVAVWIVGAFRLTMYMQERRAKLSASGRRRAPKQAVKRTGREPAEAGSPAARPAAARPATAASEPVTTRTGSRRSADPRRASTERKATAEPAPPRTRRAATSRTNAEQPQRAQATRGFQPPPSAPPTSKSPRPQERRTHSRGADAPRPRSAESPRYADQPPHRDSAERRGQPERPATSARTGQRRRTDAPRQTGQTPMPEGATTGRRRRQQESVREYAERQGEVPRYRARSQDPVPPDTTDPDKQAGYPKLPNVRYRD